MDFIALTGLTFVAAGVVIGLALYVVAARFQTRVEQARHWSEAPALIETARIANLGKGKFQPKLTYSYSVGGTGYTGRRLQFGGVAMSRDEAEAVMAAYPSGAPTVVRYDPHRHDFAVLRVDADVRGYRLAGVLVGLSFVIAGLVVVIAG